MDPYGQVPDFTQFDHEEPLQCKTPECLMRMLVFMQFCK